MDGIQATAYERIAAIMLKLKSGAYGLADDCQVGPLHDDLEGALCDLGDW